MNNLRLDDCSHCACLTSLSGYTQESAVKELESGKLGCDNCMDIDPDDKDHHQCVALFDGDEVVWDGRHKTPRRVDQERDA